MDGGNGEWRGVGDMQTLSGVAASVDRQVFRPSPGLTCMPGR